MSKIETFRCDVCEKMREPEHFGGIQWLEVYWVEQGNVDLHACGDCRYVMERLLQRLGFHVEVPCAAGPDIKRIDQITISGFYGAVDDRVPASGPADTLVYSASSSAEVRRLYDLSSEGEATNEV